MAADLEANKAVVVRAWAAYDKGDVDGFAACLTDDWREYDGAGNETRLDDEREAMAAHRVAFPDKRTEVEAIVAEGDLVSVMTHTTATHLGRYFDAAPAGKAVRIHEISLHRVRDGRIAQTWAEINGPGFYQQITGRPSPGVTDNMG
jgi:predicted ester cyclase